MNYRNRAAPGRVDAASGQKTTGPQRGGETPNQGLAGYTWRARRDGPDDATDTEICRVAWIAFNEQRPVEAVWEEIENEP